MTGGTKIYVGHDINMNETLDPEEIDKTLYVCDGEDALNALISVSDEDKGDNCFDGGKKIEIGFDTNNNKILEDSEVKETTYLCYLSSMITMTSDRDNDGLTDIYEITHDLDPENPDIDNDGINDGDEVANGTDPENPDTEKPVNDEFLMTSRLATEELRVFFDLNGTDDTGITHWLVTQSETAPESDSKKWLEQRPEAFTTLLESGKSEYALYAWGKDAAGNISESVMMNVGISDFYIREEIPNPGAFRSMFVYKDKLIYASDIYFYQYDDKSGYSELITKSRDCDLKYGFDDPIIYNGRLIFEGMSDETWEYGGITREIRKLYQYDGNMIQNIPVAMNCDIKSMSGHGFFEMNGKLYFDGTNSEFYRRLYEYDGASVKEVPIAPGCRGISFNSSATEFNGKYYIYGQTPEVVNSGGNCIIYEFDGTSIKDLALSAGCDYKVGHELKLFNNMLMLKGRDDFDSDQYKLYEYNGLDLSNVQIKDGCDITALVNYRNLFVYNDTLIFSGYDGSTYNNGRYKEKVYVYDKIAIDRLPVDSGCDFDSLMKSPVVENNRFYFIGINTSESEEPVTNSSGTDVYYYDGSSIKNVPIDSSVENGRFSSLQGSYSGKLLMTYYVDSKSLLYEYSGDAIRPIPIDPLSDFERYNGRYVDCNGNVVIIGVPVNNTGPSKSLLYYYDGNTIQNVPTAAGVTFTNFDIHRKTPLLYHNKFYFHGGGNFTSSIYSLW